MVLGIGEGSIDIVVDRTSFHRGEAVRGKVVLKLGQPKKARGLRVSLIAERDVWRNDRHGRNVKQVETVFSNPARLDGEKEYAAGEASYDFELAVPNIGNRCRAAWPARCLARWRRCSAIPAR